MYLKDLNGDDIVKRMNKQRVNCLGTHQEMAVENPAVSILNDAMGSRGNRRSRPRARWLKYVMYDIEK